MDRLNVAIIGCGRISSVYKHNFKQLEDRIRVCFAVDKREEKAKDFAADFAGCQVETDYRKILDSKLDVIHIATPHHLHYPMTMAALEKGINVLVEKPMALNLEDADKMIAEADRRNLQLGVIFQTRYVKGSMEIKKLITEGKLGKLTSARSYLSWSRSDDYYQKSDWKGTWDKEGGGVLIDQAIHSIDRVQWLIGQPVEWIKGSMDNRFHEIVDVEDVAEAFVMFENNCLYHLYACNCFDYDAPIKIEIVGEKGKAGLKQDLAWVDLDDQPYYEIKDGYDGLSVGPNYWGCSHITQIKEFYNSLINGQDILVDGKEGKTALQIVKGIYKSALSGKKVSVPFVDSNISGLDLNKTNL